MNVGLLTEEHLPSLLALCRATLLYDRPTAAVLRQRVLGDPAFNPNYLLGVWQPGGQLVGALLGSTRLKKDDPEGWVRLLAVDAAQHRQGVATVLLAHFEDQLRRDGLTRLNVGGSAPNYFWPGVDLRYTEMVCFLLARGFQRSGDAVNMEVRLGGRDFTTQREEMTLAAAGIRVRRLRNEDRQHFGESMTVWGPVWVQESAASLENAPVTTFVAERKGQFIGFASYDVAAFEGAFGPMGVKSEERTHGLGRVLFLRCLADMQARGYAASEIQWVGPIPFYARTAGARIIRCFWLMSKNL